MYSDLLLTVRTSLHAYMVRRDQVGELRIVTSNADLERPDERGRSIIAVELGILLDPDDERSQNRCHALVVPMRRRSVALLVERVEDMETMRNQPDMLARLPPLLAQRLDYAWFLGVVVQEDKPILVLDVRQIARDILLSQST